MKAFLTNLSQLFHIIGFAGKKKGQGEWAGEREREREGGRERAIAFIRELLTYFTAIKYIYAMYTILIKLIEKNVQTLYFLASRENQMCSYLIAHIYKMLWIYKISFQSMEENLLINHLLS